MDCAAQGRHGAVCGAVQSVGRDADGSTGEMLEGTYSAARELWTGEKQQMTDGVTATLGKHDAAVFWVE